MGDAHECSGCVHQDVCEVRIKMQEERHRRNEARIGDMEKTMQEVVQLNTKFATLLEQQEKEVNDHEQRLEKMESSDSKWMDQIKLWIGAAIVTTMMNVFFQAVGM